MKAIKSLLIGLFVWICALLTGLFFPLIMLLGWDVNIEMNRR